MINDSTGDAVLTGDNASISDHSSTEEDVFYWEKYLKYIDNKTAMYEIKDDKGLATGLKVPAEVLEGEDDKNDTARYYVDLLKDYLQKWIVPYTMMIDSQDKTFIDRVMDEMYHIVDVNVYKLSKEEKNTNKVYYMKAIKKEYISQYIIYNDDASKTKYTIPSTIEIKETKTNTKNDKLGDRGTTDRVINSNVVRDGRKGELHEELRVYVELDPAMEKATDANGKPLVKEIVVTRDFSSYKNVPKVTNIESFYDIVKEKYKVKPISEKNPANSSSTSKNVDSGEGLLSEGLTEVWYEEVEQVGQTEKKTYKVSYYTDEEVENLGRKISRVEWAQDYGIGKVNSNANDNGIIQYEKGGYSGTIKTNNIEYKLYDQNKFKGEIPAAGSGLTCQATILSGYKKDFNYNPNGLAKELNWTSAGSLTKMSSDFKKYGISCEIVGWGENSSNEESRKAIKTKLESNLKSNKPVIALVQPGCPYAEKISQYIALLKIDNNSEVTLFNPNGGITKTDSIEKIIDYIVSGEEKSEKGLLLITSEAEKQDSEKDNKSDVSEENSQKLTEMLQKGMELESQIPYTFDNSVHSTVDAMLDHGTDCAGFAISMYQIYFSPAFDYSYFASQGFSVYSIFSTCEVVDKDGIKGQRVFDGGGGTCWNDEIASIIRPGDIVYTSGHISLYAGDIKGDGNLYVLSHGGGNFGLTPGPTIHEAQTYYDSHPILGITRFVSDAEILGGYGGTGQMYPSKTAKEKADAKEKYGDGKGYSYDDLYFAYYHIEQYYSNLEEVNGHSLNDNYGPGLGWPVDIKKYKGCEVINCFYGYTPAYGQDHSGIDISASSYVNVEGNLHVGPEVIAAHDGTVTVATANPSSDSDGYTYVQIKNDEGTIETQYGHLSKIFVKVGDKVTKGQVIGKMGTTGRSTGTHLHYAVFENGNRTDPLNYYVIAKVGSDEEVDYSTIDKSKITTLGLYKYLREKGGGISKLAEYIWEMEGNDDLLIAWGWLTPDKKYYIIQMDGAAHTRAVGHGIDLDAGGYEAVFKKAGYGTSVGSKIPKEFVDNLSMNLMLETKQSMASQFSGLKLTDYQLDALVSRSYNCGYSGAVGYRNGMNFEQAYKKYWRDSDKGSKVNYNHLLYTNYMSTPVTSDGVVYTGLISRRKSEWKLFQTGVYEPG